MYLCLLKALQNTHTDTQCGLVCIQYVLHAYLYTSEDRGKLIQDWKKSDSISD